MQATGKRSKLNPQALHGLREFEFTDTDFAQAIALYRSLTGMRMGTRKSDLVYSRLIRRLRVTGCTSFDAYLKKAAGEPAESEQFVNALTTNLTSFFREPHHFPILTEHAKGLGRAKKLRIWCAASSTGEEPYSIAMALAQAFKQAPPPVEIIATDLDTSVLQAARQGIYEEGRAGSIPAEMRQRFCLRGKDSQRGRMRIAASIRQSVSFEQLNLLGAHWPLQGQFDSIFLRNVLIYFDRAAQLQTLARIESFLRDDGLLFTGHSESLFYASHLFRPLGPTVYCKVHSALKRLVD